MACIRLVKFLKCIEGSMNPPSQGPSKNRFQENHMRKLFILVFAFVIAACGAPPATATEAPVQEIIQPTQTAMVVLQTVVVTVVPTDLPTDVPSATPLPAPTEIPATQPPAPTAAVAAPTGSTTDSGLVNVDNALGGGWFSNMTLTGDTLALRCQQFRDITFTAQPSDPSITQVDFYYRIEDRTTGAVFDWQGPRRMLADANGNFTLTFAGEDVNTNFRKDNAWFDFQFIGLSRSGGRVGSSEKIIQQVNYVFDCP